MWDLSCPDWADRLATGRSLIRDDLPLVESEARMGLAFFDEMCLPDVEGKPKMRDAAGEWWRDLVYTHFGAWDPVHRVRSIRDMFCLAPKGSSKTSYGAGMVLTVALMNKRPRAEALFIGPTQSVSDRAYEQAVGMIDESADLKKRFRPRDHIKTIEDLLNGTEIKVKTFDLNILTGAILIFAHLDELHLLGRVPYAGKVIRQIRGGLNKTPEGALLITTTQSDEPPAGAMKDELYLNRKIRDGKMVGQTIRPTLPLLYEFPEHIAKDPALWGNPEHWPMVMPNLGRSVHLADLVPDWETEKAKGDHARRVWASQHLNIEIGVGLKTEAWPGAEFWESSADPALTFETLLQRSEAIVVGGDGGGLDDLFGASVLGREIGSKRWLSWSWAWAHLSVLTRRPSIAARLCDFAQADAVDDVVVLRAEPKSAAEMELIDDEFIDITDEVEDLLVGEVESVVLPKDVAGFVLIVAKVKRAGKLAAVALDMEGPYGELIDALAMIGVTPESGEVKGIGQGYRLMHSIKGMERKLANKTMVHAVSKLMDWCVGNIKIEPTATAIRATKQNAGDDKIDPAMAMFDAGSVMQTNPVAGRSVFDELADEEDTPDANDEDEGGIDLDVLADPQHPRFALMRERYNTMLAARDAMEDEYV